MEDGEQEQNGDIPLGDTEGDELGELSIEQELDAAEAAEHAPIAGSSSGGIEKSGKLLLDVDDYARRFASFVEGLGLRYFQSKEFLFLGGSNGAGGRCAGRNSLPPENLWRNVANTARMLDAIRHRLGAPISILSAYRSQSYNQCVGGKPSSLHLRFNAIDFAGRSGTAAEWWRAAREVRESQADFEGGIGRYGGFVHIDTRGSRADW